ncbi:DinB family protein [Fulvivirgaceae bacterium BMA10]|uniref:DinB family protein n=1 Tax=Splendidivirga corallicola TaxID=3051826 RepID=A0ABT8KQ10_9BACT|nr:DinB family protein [Fulvivirgaceae bacterium BMA10]
MKKILVLFTCFTLLLLTAGVQAQSELTKEERSKAIDHLKTSQSDLMKTIKGLSEEQLKFKPNDETWSIEECVEHIAISESAIFGIVEMSLKAEADPAKRDELKFSDDQVIGLITNRDQKVKTREEFKPQNNFGSFDGSVKKFKEKRNDNIKYVKSTGDDLRNHYFEFPFGLVDSYQVILFLSGHSVRHTSQIKEIMAHESFPKS